MEEKLIQKVFQEFYDSKHGHIAVRDDEGKVHVNAVFLDSLQKALRSEIEAAMPEKYQTLCSHPSTNHIHGMKEIPVDFWTPYHDQYNAMIDDIKSNLLKELDWVEEIKDSFNTHLEDKIITD